MTTLCHGLVNTLWPLLTKLLKFLLYKQLLRIPINLIKNHLLFLKDVLFFSLWIHHHRVVELMFSIQLFFSCRMITLDSSIGFQSVWTFQTLQGYLLALGFLMRRLLAKSQFLEVYFLLLLFWHHIIKLLIENDSLMGFQFRLEALIKDQLFRSF